MCNNLSTLVEQFSYGKFLVMLNESDYTRFLPTYPCVDVQKVQNIILYLLLAVFLVYNTVIAFYRVAQSKVSSCVFVIAALNTGTAYFRNSSPIYSAVN